MSSLVPIIEAAFPLTLNFYFHANTFGHFINSKVLTHLSAKSQYLPKIYNLYYPDIFMPVQQKDSEI